MQIHKLIYYITGKEPLKKEEIKTLLTEHNKQADEDNRFPHSSIDFTAWFIAGASEEEKNHILEKLETGLDEFTRHMTEIESSPLYSAVFELEKALESALRSCTGENEVVVKLIELGAESIRKRIEELKDITENSQIEILKEDILEDIGGLRKAPEWLKNFSPRSSSIQECNKTSRPRAATSVKRCKTSSQSGGVRSSSF